VDNKTSDDTSFHSIYLFSILYTILEPRQGPIERIWKQQDLEIDVIWSE